MKILMLMRDNAFSHRGGDTVVLENLSKELIALGHQVTIDVNGVEDLKKFDIAHLFNFATREKLELLARRCVATGIKFVVTTLYEDWPKFFNQMIIQELLLAGYVKTGQPIQQWESFEGKALTSNPSPIQDNTYAALSAQILVPSGYNESVSLRRDYPDAGPIRVCNYGYQISSYTDGGKLFKETYNVDNYILCVGRLEQRKNQLSLLKALETSDHTIVFAGGGFSYEENYAAACNKFIRRGKTIFLGRVSSEMLASCYDGAKVHALPSWYELPGLVSIEAAARKVPCVVTDYGTIRDYLGDNAYYCSPGDTHDIRDAVERAFLTPRSEALLADVSRFTWQNSALQMVPIYEEALSMEINYANLEKLKNFPFKGDKKGSVEELLKDYPALSGLIKEIR